MHSNTVLMMKRPHWPILVIIAIFSLTASVVARGQTEGCFPQPASSSDQAKPSVPIRRDNRAASTTRSYPIADGSRRMSPEVPCGSTPDALNSPKPSLRRHQRIQAYPPSYAPPTAEVRCGEDDVNIATPVTKPRVVARHQPTTPTTPVYQRRHSPPVFDATDGCLPDSNVHHQKTLRGPTQPLTSQGRPTSGDTTQTQSHSGPIVQAAAAIQAEWNGEPRARYSPQSPLQKLSHQASQQKPQASIVRMAEPAFLPRSITHQERPNISPAPAHRAVAAPSQPKIRLVQATEEYFPSDDYSREIERLDDSVTHEPSPCDNVGDGTSDSPCETDKAMIPLPASPAPDEAPDEGPFRDPDEIEPAISSQQYSSANSRLSDMRLGKVFTRLESLPDKFIPSPEHSSRDPYYGTNNIQSKKWAPRNLAHRTLYFEDMPLERYGLTKVWYKQMLASATEFFCDAAKMPLRWGKEEPCSLHYTLGQQRAGSCPPRIKEKACPVP